PRSFPPLRGPRFDPACIRTRRAQKLSRLVAVDSVVSGPQDAAAGDAAALFPGDDQEVTARRTRSPDPLGAMTLAIALAILEAHHSPRFGVVGIGSHP